MPSLELHYGDDIVSPGLVEPVSQPLHVSSAVDPHPVRHVIDGLAIRGYDKATVALRDHMHRMPPRNGRGGGIRTHDLLSPRQAL